MSTAVMNSSPFPTTWEPVDKPIEPSQEATRDRIEEMVRDFFKDFPALANAMDSSSFSTDLPKENIQMKIARIVGKIFETFSDLSLNEQEKVANLKKEIKDLAKVHSEATSSQGTIALVSGLLGFAFTAASCAPDMSEHMQRTLPGIGNLLSDTGNRFFNSKQEMKITLTSSQRELLMRALDQSVNDSQSKSQTRREFLEALKEILQTAQNASRGS